MAALSKRERLMTEPGPSKPRAGGVRSRVADATAAVAGGAVGAAVKGVIGGVQGAAKGIRDGWSMRGQFRRRTR